jgi:hypothetical protein
MTATAKQQAHRQLPTQPRTVWRFHLVLLIAGAEDLEERADGIMAKKS